MHGEGCRFASDSGNGVKEIGVFDVDADAGLVQRGLFMSSSLSSWCFYIYILWHYLYTSLSMITIFKFRQV